MNSAGNGNGSGHKWSMSCVILSLVCAVILMCSSGCTTAQRFMPEGPPYDWELRLGYDQTVLKLSSSSDVLNTIALPDYELLSTSRSVVACAGEKKHGHKSWLKMVAFDENTLTAQRNYILIVDDTPALMDDPKKYLSFDCEMVLQSQALAEPYANENARRIAILRRVRENTLKDRKEIGPDNKLVNINAMLINQVLEAALVELDNSPVLASRLPDRGGIEFSHLSFGKGRLQMVVQGNTVKIRLRMGSAAKGFEKPEEPATETQLI